MNVLTQEEDEDILRRLPCDIFSPGRPGMRLGMDISSSLGLGFVAVQDRLEMKDCMVRRYVQHFVEPQRHAAEMVPWSDEMQALVGPISMELIASGIRKNPSLQDMAKCAFMPKDGLGMIRMFVALRGSGVPLVSEEVLSAADLIEKTAHVPWNHYVGEEEMAPLGDAWCKAAQQVLLHLGIPAAVLPPVKVTKKCTMAIKRAWMARHVS